MAFSPELYLAKLIDTLQKIEEHPENEIILLKKYVDDIFEFQRKRIEDARQGVISMVCFNLYEADYKKLCVDLAKIKLGNLHRETLPEERFEFLRCFADTIELYFKDSFAGLVNQVGNMVKLSEVMEDTDSDNDLPFN